MKKFLALALLLTNCALVAEEMAIELAPAYTVTTQKLEDSLKANDTLAFIVQIQKTEDTPSWDTIARSLAVLVTCLNSPVVALNEIGDALKDILATTADDKKLVGSYEILFANSKQQDPSAV